MNTVFSIRNLLIFFFTFSGGMLFSQKTYKIIIENAEEASMDNTLGKGTQKLVGDVIFNHQGIKMYCDSAYNYEKSNTFDAFGHVYINQGDTLHLYGDYLNYNGNTRLAKVRDNVHLLNDSVTLTTDYLNYDRATDVAYYFNNGKVVDNRNVLTSVRGFHYTRQKKVYFKDSVILVNPKYTIYSDTLMYHTETYTSYFLGPTRIISEENLLYCENGWYNTKTDISQFNQNAYLEGDGQKLKGDSLYYDRKKKMGRGFQNVEIIDTAERIIVRGHYGEYFEEPEKMLMTDSALFIQYDKGDSIFLHADTLRSRLDSTKTYKILSAYYDAKIFKNDLQGACDSIAYSFKDSVIRLYRKPVLWVNENQMTGKFMEIFTKNRQIDKMEIYEQAFIISEEDTKRYNQIKGKNMTCYFQNNQLHKIDVIGNAETIYYATEEKPPVDTSLQKKPLKELIGINQAASSNLRIYFAEKKPDRIIFLDKPEGTLNPPFEKKPEELKLKGFIWLNEKRPKMKEDLFK